VPIVAGYDPRVTAAERTRQARGERRRQVILEAALHVIAERGVAATTHRAVAERAEVPVAATTYYFESLDELLDEALLLFVREEAERLTALSARLEGERPTPAEIARLLLAELRTIQPEDLPAEIGQFELYLEAARRPGLREVVRQALDLYTEAAEAALRAAGSPRPAEGARLFVALLDGLGLHRIASGRDEDVTDALLALLIPFAMDDAERTRWDERLRGERP
jgi:TetR/AcrR family transcriptional regulator, regulator of biofilm formation and stress response